MSVALPLDAQKAMQVARLAQAQSDLAALLPRLTRDELRAACRAHELDYKGRSRAELMSRLGVEQKPATPETDRQIHHELGLPYAGDIAVVRHRQYMVESVHPAPVPGQQTLVKLVCLDDDAPGKELDVFWERELGARVIKPEDKGLGAIERLDSPRHFAAYPLCPPTCCSIFGPQTARIRPIVSPIVSCQIRNGAHRVHGRANRSYAAFASTFEAVENHASTDDSRAWVELCERVR